MEKIKCIIDSQRFGQKPKGFEIGIITNRMGMQEISECSIEEIKQCILEGRTIRPAYCGSKTYEWKSQQIFMIDIDNGLTIQDAIEKCKNNNVTPNFIYTSFSHSEELHKFRLVFIFKQEISSYLTAVKVQLSLMNIFQEADESCKNLNRFYFAGKSIVFQSDNMLDLDVFNIDYNETQYAKIIDNTRSLMQKDNINNFSDIMLNSMSEGQRVLTILNDINISPNILSTPRFKSTHDNMYNIKALSMRDNTYLQEKLNRQHTQFENDGEFWNYIYHNINLAELLEITYAPSFKCIFHDDTSPSASIFQNAEGVWLYRCNGQCNFTLNIKQLIEKLGGFKSEHKAIQFIKDIYNLSIKETKWSIEQKANLDSIIDSLDMGTFSQLCPQTDKNIAYVKGLFRTMVAIAKKNIYGENYMNSDGDVVFFVSLRELAKILKVSEKNIQRISQRLAVLTYHDLIRKLDDDKIPEQMLKRAIAIAIDRDYEKRINFYAIPSWVFEQMNHIRTQGEKWKSHGYTIKGTSYEMFYRGEGLEIAQYLYPQHKKVSNKFIDQNTGEIITTLQDRTPSNYSNEKTDLIISCIDELIAESGYATESQIIEKLSHIKHPTIIATQLKKIRGELTCFGLKRIKVTKEMKEKYGMETIGYPIIIINNSDSKNIMLDN